MSIAKALKEIVAAGRPLIEQSMDTAEQIAALRDAATEKGIDWSAIKALLKAQIQDERDDKGRVQKIVDRAENSSAYADMLGLGGEEKIISPPQSTSGPAEGITKLSDSSAVEQPSSKRQVGGSNPPQATTESGAAELGSLPPLGESEPVVTQACGRAGASSAVSMAPAFRIYTDAELEIPDYLRRPLRAS